MSTRAFDVVVAGAGPAGATAALSLARKGASVALVDPFEENGIRVGESLAPQIREPLMHLGLWERFAAAGHRPAYAIRSAWGSSEPRDQDHIFNPYGTGWHVDRRAFDRMLVDAVREAGGEVIRGAVRPGGIEARGAFVVDATGRAARVARRLGARRIALDRLIGVVASVPPDETTTSAEGVTLVEAVANGWWYSARTPDDRLLLAYMTDADLWRRCDGLSAAIECAPLTRARLRAVPDLPLHIVAAASSHLQPCGGPGWLAAGDAAMAIDPLAGNGVGLAIRSGMRAAEAILRGDSTDYVAEVARAFAQYETTWRWFYAQEQRFATSEFWRRRAGP